MRTNIILNDQAVADADLIEKFYNFENRSQVIRYALRLTASLIDTDKDTDKVTPTVEQVDKKATE